MARHDAYSGDVAASDRHLASSDALASDEPVLASLYAASAADVQLLGNSLGQRTAKRVAARRRRGYPAAP